MELESQTAYSSNFNDAQNIDLNIAGTYNNQNMEPNIMEQILKELKSISKAIAYGNKRQDQMINLQLQSLGRRGNKKQKRLRKNKVSRNQANRQINVNEPFAIKTNSQVESISGLFNFSPNDINNGNGANQQKSNQMKNQADQVQDIEQDVSANETKEKRRRKSKNQKEMKQQNAQQSEPEYAPQKWRIQKIQEDIKHGRRTTRKGKET